MPSARSYDELNNMKLVQREVGKTYEMRVLSAQKYAAIQKAVEQQSITAALQARLDANAKEHADWLAREQARITTELANMQRSGATAAQISTKRTQLEKQLAAARAVEEDNLAAKQLALNAEIARSKEADAQRVANVASRLADAEYNKLTIYQRRQVQQELQDAAHVHAVELQNQYQANAEALKLLSNKARYAVAGSEEEAAYQNQINALVEEQAQLKAQIRTADSTERAAFAEKLNLQESILRAQREYVLTQPNHNGAAQLLQNIEAATDEAKTKLEQLEIEIAANAKVDLDTTELEREKFEIEASLGNFEKVMGSAAEDLYAAAAADTAQKTHTQAEQDLKKIKAQSTSDMARAMNDERAAEKAQTDKQAIAQWKQFMSPEGIKDNLGKAVANAVENVAAEISQAINQIDDNINNFYKYQSSVEARLQGSDESYKKSLKNISKNVGISGLVSQKDVIENLKKLSEAGIAYNLDLRAFLATIKDDIAETFDVFDSNLMRLIRLQQSDTTAARLGMEASLTRLFNEFFSDTSYLTDAANSVSQALIDANSQLTRDMSVEFEYMVQKWLGSLYSLGMDSGTISTIAQGLNYLGTGNVEALNGNESLQSLLAMSASRAGISYADILTGGLDAETTNNLMKSMIEYLKSIAENTDNNQVTKSAYSNVFGFSISDLTAVSSLNDTDIENIHKQSINYQGAMDEYAYQASQIYNRTHFSQMLNTVFDNAIMSASTAIGNSAGTYALWKVLNVVEDLTGGIAIPGISIFGNMVDLHQTVTGLAKTGIAGLGLMGSLLGSLFNGSMFGTTAVDKWGYEEFTSRGSATKGISKGTAQGTSESTSMNMVGSSSADDIKSTSMNDATDEADEDSKVTNKNVEENADIYAKIYEAIANEETSVLSEAITTNELLRTHTFKTSSEGLSDLLDPARIFYTAIVSSIPLIGREQLELRDSGAFYVNQEKLDQLYQSQEIVYSAIKSSSVASSTTYDALLTAFESFASDTSSTQSNTNEKTTVETTSGTHFDGVWPVITLLTSAYESLKENATTWALLQSDETKISEAVYTKTLQELKATAEPSAEAQLAVENITSLVDSVSKWETLVAASEAQYNSESYNVTFPNSLQTSLADMSPEVTALIERLVTNALTKVFTGNSTTSQDEEMPLSKLIENVLTQTFNVNVTNDNFDTALQKTAFTT